MSKIEQMFRHARKVALDSYEYKKVLEEFTSILSFEAKHVQRNHVMVLDRAERILFVGDVHGDLETLYEVFVKRVDLYTHLREGGYVVFLGDYVDRGAQQLEALSLIALLKSEWRSQIITLRGNHEPPPWLPPYPHDYPQYLVMRFGREEGEQLYELSQRVFECLPLMVYVPNNLLAVHGGPPILRVLKYSNADDILRISEDKTAIEDILWSDPIEENVEWIPSYRGAGKLWGYRVTEQTLSKLNIKLIIRAHEPCIAGYKLNHGNKVLTLFTMRGYYGNISAAVALIDLTRDRWYDEVNRYIITV